MNDPTSEKLRPYIAMRDAGFSNDAVFEQMKKDGWKTADCMLIVAGIYDMELGDVRAIWHAFYRQQKAVNS